MRKISLLNRKGRQTMKRAIAVALAMIMSVGTAACGNSEVETPTIGDGNQTGTVTPGAGTNVTPGGQETPEKPQNGDNDPIANAESAGFHAAKDYNEIYELYKKKAESGNRNNGWGWTTDDEVAVEESKSEVAADGMMNSASGAAPEGAPAPDGAASDDFSSTNVQVEGIDESDIVKTDGNYIYILKRNNAEEQKKPEVVIISVNDFAVVSTTPIDAANSYYSYSDEMYVVGDKLVFLAAAYENGQSLRYYWNYSNPVTDVVIYDISDRSHPVLETTHRQDGSYITSRMKDGIIYTVSEKYNGYFYIMDDYIINEDLTEQLTNETSLDKEEVEQIVESRDPYAAAIPKVDGEMIPCEHILYRDEDFSNVYTTITSIKVAEPEHYVDTLSLMVNSEHLYMSHENIFFGATNWNWQYEYNNGYFGDFMTGLSGALAGMLGEVPEGAVEKITETEAINTTHLIRIAYENGTFTPKAQGVVPGTLDDRFSMDESNGYLRIVTTSEYSGRVYENGEYYWSSSRDNGLYILDSEMNIVGSLEKLAEEERIYSARFIGDMAYFVTFRQTDPLFSVDVSDPTNPVLKGALKIPGFSDYLHPYGDHLLLGIGMDSGNTNNVKLSMFDITDPTNVVEKDTYIVEGYNYSEACYNSKAVLANAAKNLIGLPATAMDWYYDEQDYSKENYEWRSMDRNVSSYLIFSYDEENGFVCKDSMSFASSFVSMSPERFFELKQQGALSTFPMIYEENGVYTTNKTDLFGNEVDEIISFWDEQKGYTYYGDDGRTMRGLYIGNYFYIINIERKLVKYEMGDSFVKIGELGL